MSKQRVNILIADDEVFIREGLKEALDHDRYRVEIVSDGRQAREKLRTGRYHLAILDLRMPGPSGLDLLEELRDREADTQVVILTAHGNVSTAVEAMKKGAHDFLTKPVDLGHLRLVVERALDRLQLVRENRKLHSRLESADPFRRLVRNSESMQAASKLIKQVAQSDVPVLLRAASAASGPLLPSTAAALPKNYSPVRYSDTSAEPLPEHTQTSPAVLRWQKAALSFSTK